MRCNPWRWIWGLIPIVGIAWIAVQVEHAKIERDLTMRGKLELARLGFDWADLSFTGRDGTLSGKATEESEANRAVAAALQTWGVRSVIDNSGLIDKIDRYEWTAMRRDNRIRLNGLVPNEKTRRDVIGIVKASFPNLEIEDRLRLARGAPATDTWLGGVGFGIKQLAHLRSGQIDLEVTSLSVTGEALDVQAYRAVKQALARELPPGIRLKLDRVTAPVVKPYVWSAKLARGQMLLSGYVVSEDAHRDIMAAVRDVNENLNVIDETHVAEGAPDGWADSAIAIVRGLARLEEGQSDMRDASLTISGLAPSAAEAAAARTDLQRIASTIKVADQIRARPPAIPVISPYVTGAVLDGGALSFFGHAPADDARRALLDQARERVKGAPVQGDLQIGSGQPAGWQACMEAAVEALARAGSGRANLVDNRLELHVSTSADEVARTLADQVQQKIAGACEADVDVAFIAPPEPSLKWSAVRGASEVVLSGDVAGEETHAELLRTARTLFPDTQLTDKMTVAPQKSANWTRTAREGLVQLSRLRHGEVALVDRELTIAGEAAEEGAAEAVRDGLAQNLPKGYRGHVRVEVRPDPPSVLQAQEPTSAILPRASEEQLKRQAEADACQGKLSTVVRTGTIHFARDSAEIDAASIPTLKRLAEVASACSGVRFEIAGHTDADGRPQHNQVLSEQRAQAIADFLARSGVDRERMKAVGYGETRPLAPNTSATNKAENRRIEFSVKVE